MHRKEAHHNGKCGACGDWGACGKRDPSKTPESPHKPVYKAIYVRLIDRRGKLESRPTWAEEVRPGVFKVLGIEGAREIWEFQPGYLVRCVERNDPETGEPILIASERHLVNP